MPDPRGEANECVIYTDGFKNRIHGNLVFPTQAFGKTTLLDFVNQYDTVMVERYRYSQRKGLDFVLQPTNEHVDPAIIAYVPTSSICLVHGYVQYGSLSKFDDDRLKALGYEEIPVFLHFTITPDQPNELVFGRVLGKIPAGHRDPVKARLDALEANFKSRPRFFALHDPSNVLLHTWFQQEEWQDRKHHEQKPPSIVLSRNLVSLFGLQRPAAPSA